MMRIPAPNYTQTPNVFFDEIMKTLNEGELRILLYIMRQTFGWHKSEDWITLKILAEKTGYERRSVCRILERLIEKRLVFKRIEGREGQQKCYYSLVTDSEPREIPDETDGVETQEEMAIFKKFIPVTDGSPPSDRRVTGPVTGGSPTKETNTKETRQKKQQQYAYARNPDGAENDRSAVVVFSNHQEKDKQQAVCSKASTSSTAKPASNCNITCIMTDKSSVLSDSNSKNIPQTPPKVIKSKVHECLQNFQIDPDPKTDSEEKRWLMARYPEDIIKNAIEWAIENESKRESCIAAYLKMACSKGLKKALNPIDQTERNKAYAMKHDGMHWYGDKNIKVIALNKAVIIEFGIAAPLEVSYDDKAFISKFESMLKKIEIEPLPWD